ncbi:MAG TPA: type II toxin-antitoxin system PemK/MazF family toxin [Pirellulaceae bacterium]|nr:type II toxin-antitoxin system PemK/MazF family toxin [Pirellulaceae bacterium]
MAHIQQGDVYALFGDAVGKRRLVVIVTCNALLGGDAVQVIPFTSKQLEKRRQLAYCAFFPAGAFGQDLDCVAKADMLTLMDKMEIDFAVGKIGTLTSAQLARVFEALDAVHGR